VERFLEEAARRGLGIPGMFGVFYYRSANPRTLAALAEFLPVPSEGLTAEFSAGVGADDVCRRTLGALWGAGARHAYVSNLPLASAHRTLRQLAEGAPGPSVSANSASTPSS
jgi:hypothetical protein